MSTAVLGVAGVASAAPASTLSAGQSVSSADVSGFIVASAIGWQVSGSSGGVGSDEDGYAGGVTATTDTTASETFSLFPSGAGDVDAGGTVYGGGGGGGGGPVVVSSVGGPVLGAFGGDGGDADFTDYGHGGGHDVADGEDVDLSRTGDGGAGSISARGVACVSDALTSTSSRPVTAP